MKSILYTILSYLIFLPSVSLAAVNSEPPSKSIVPECTGSGGVNYACGYDNLVGLGQNILSWSIYLVILASVISITWAGWLYISAMGDSGKLGEAKEVLWKVVCGIVITLSAWLLVKSVLTWLGVAGEWTFLS